MRWAFWIVTITKSTFGIWEVMGRMSNTLS
jgi:hypothetical protein